MNGRRRLLPRIMRNSSRRSTALLNMDVAGVPEEDVSGSRAVASAISCKMTRWWPLCLKRARAHHIIVRLSRHGQTKRKPASCAKACHGLTLSNHMLSLQQRDWDLISRNRTTKNTASEELQGDDTSKDFTTAHQRSDGLVYHQCSNNPILCINGHATWTAL